MSLIEIALLTGRRSLRPGEAQAVFLLLEERPNVSILPVTIAIASEIAAIGETLRDPGDRTIVSTARLHRLRLLTSDRHIIESGLVETVD
jgi:PIN domain nuclease of toxin-antitoxin system